MRNEPLYQKEQKAGCTRLEPNKKRYNSDSTSQIKPSTKASRESMTKALGAPTKRLATLNFEKYKIPPLLSSPYRNILRFQAGNDMRSVAVLR